MDGFIEAIIAAFNIWYLQIHWVVLGVLIGMALGLIPGMGGIVTLTLILPFTLAMDTYSAFALLTGAFGATTFAGSITAILINTPGTSSNAATVIDGYELTKKGESRTAISISAFSSASGAIVAAILFILTIPILMEFALLFGPSEVAWLVFIALIIIPIIVGDRVIFGIISAGIGALVAFIGQAPSTGEPRVTFGSPNLFDGLEIMAVLVGMFALAEVYRLSGISRNSIVSDKFEISGGRMDGLSVLLKNKWLWLRCSVIGFVVGAIPGAGGTPAAFIAYAHGAATSRTPEEFGRGSYQGILSAESANDAKDGGQLLPTLGLGIPGSGTMAVLLAGMLMHGVFPGPQMIQNELYLILVIAYSLILANVLTSIIGLLSVNIVSKIIEVPLDRLLPLITILALSAAYIVRNNEFDVFFTLLFGILGIIFIYLNISRIPFIIAFILSTILEENYHLAMAYARDDWYNAFFTGTLNLILILILILALTSLMVPSSIKTALKDRIMGILNNIG